MWHSEMATSLMERVAHQEQRSAANNEDVGTLRQFMDATEAKLTKMVQQHSSELRAQEERVAQVAVMGEISQSVSETMDLYAARLEALETVSNEIHWTEQASSSGTRYYYNTKTKQSTWERPAAFQPAIKSTETLVETSLAEERATREEFENLVMDETRERLGDMEEKLNDCEESVVRKSKEVRLAHFQLTLNSL